MLTSYKYLLLGLVFMGLIAGNAMYYQHTNKPPVVVQQPPVVIQQPTVTPPVVTPSPVVVPKPVPKPKKPKVSAYCKKVVSYVKQYGMDNVIQAAKMKGFTDQQIAYAKKCMSK